jgi:hypothetical protein
VLHWELEVIGEGEPWSERIDVAFAIPVNENSRFWTAWSAPPNAEGNWTDPLEPAPFADCTYYYGAPAFTESEPLTGFCPTRNDLFCIPVVMIADFANDTAFVLAISPENLLLDLEMTVSRSGEVRLSFINYRFQPDKPVRLVFDVFSSSADCRGALGWMAERYPDFFTPPNPRAHSLAGCGAYSTWEGELDAAKFLAMAFRVNWKASYDFPYMGMFMPPTAYDERYPRFMTPPNAPEEVARTSTRQMVEYSQRMNTAGFHVLNYFNVTEFGT